eukprot:6909365-Karenia_brevis.AAC.1
MDVRICKELDLGSDHRGILAKCAINRRLQRRTRPRDNAKKGSVKGWRPIDDEGYATKVDEKLWDLQCQSSIEDRCARIENVLATTAAHCQKFEESAAQTK